MIVALVALIALGTVAADVVEPKTGQRFPDKNLNRLGVRYKGPIKVYAVGEYAGGSYMLKMSYGVGAKKMTSALVDALKPRCSDGKAIEAFEACLLNGLPNGAPKGTKLVFSTGGNALKVAVNDKSVGSVGSKKLASGVATEVHSESMRVPARDTPEPGCGLRRIVALDCRRAGGASRAP